MKYILINLTLILVIFYIINQISDNFIIKKIKGIFETAKPNDFYQNINLPSGHSRKLNNFLSSMVTKNPYVNTNVKSKTYKANTNENENIIEFLKRKFKSSSKEIKNIHIGDRILFNESSNGFEFKPLVVIGEYYYNKKLIGVVKLQMELSFIVEKNGNIFINPNKFNKKCGTYIINRIFLIDFNDELKLKKNTNSSESISEVKNSQNNSDKLSSVLSFSDNLDLDSDSLELSSDINSSLLSFSSI